MKYNVLVIAGTTESRQVIEKLLAENPNERILASVATELGKEMLLEYDIDVHVGRLDQDGFLALLKENPCEKIIDASHPFAKIVSETVKKVAESADIPYERYERTNLQYDYEGIVHVKDVQEAITLLNELKGNVFLTTGVNTAAAYMSVYKMEQSAFLSVCLIMFHLWKDVQKLVIQRGIFSGKCLLLQLRIM